MSDNKKWFKVWNAILTDPHHSNMTNEQVGQWTRLMAYVSLHGESGKLVLVPPARSLVSLMNFSSFEEAISVLKLLPNVSIQSMQNDNGEMFVSFRNWFKYQVDSTAYERVKRSRYKKRGEEKRSITSTSTSSRASRPAPSGASATREKQREEKMGIKSFEEAGDNEPCLPPKGMAEKLRGLK